MSDENDDVFDEDELGEGFGEEGPGDGDGDELEIVEEESEEEDEAEDIDSIDDEAEAEVSSVEIPLVEEDELDDTDVEMALDEVLAQDIMRTSPADDDEEAPAEPEVPVEGSETPLPKQDDEFRCKSCRLLKKVSQLADKSRQLCRDCV